MNDEVCGIKCNHDGEDDCTEKCCLSDLHGGQIHWCHKHFLEAIERERTIESTELG